MVVSLPTDLDADHPDPYHAVYVNMFFQGISNLLPWNVLIFAHRYFEVRLAAVPEAENFIYYFTLIFMAMKFVFLLSGISVTQRVRPESQIAWSIGVNAAVFATIGFCCLWSSMSARLFYYLIMGLVLGAALCSSFVEAGFLNLLTFFPSRYTQSYLVGHGFAGVVAAVLHISTTLGLDSGVTGTFATVYFGVSAVLILASLLLFRLMWSLAHFQFFHGKGQAVRAAKAEAEKASGGGDLSAEGSSTVWQVLRQIGDLFVTILLLTSVGVIISPTLIVMTRSTGGTDGDKDIFHSLAFLVSSLFDLLGKAIPALSFFASRRLPFAWLAAARVLFIPLLLAGNIKLRRATLPVGPFYASDLVFFLIVAAKAVSGGYLGTLCMMRSPLRVNAMDRGRAVTLMVYAIGTGSLLGAILALVLKDILVGVSTPVGG